MYVVFLSHVSGYSYVSVIVCTWVWVLRVAYTPSTLTYTYTHTYTQLSPTYLTTHPTTHTTQQMKVCIALAFVCLVASASAYSGSSSGGSSGGNSGFSSSSNSGGYVVVSCCDVCVGVWKCSVRCGDMRQRCGTTHGCVTETVCLWSVLYGGACVWVRVCSRARTMC